MALVQCVVPGLSFWWGMDAVFHFIDSINAVFKKKKKCKNNVKTRNAFLGR